MDYDANNFIFSLL